MAGPCEAKSTNALATAELQEQLTIRRAEMIAALNVLLASGRIRRIGHGTEVPIRITLAVSNPSNAT